jgi:hypothetical protein
MGPFVTGKPVVSIAGDLSDYDVRDCSWLLVGKLTSDSHRKHPMGETILVRVQHVYGHHYQSAKTVYKVN